MLAAGTLARLEGLTFRPGKGVDEESCKAFRQWREMGGGLPIEVIGAKAV